MELWHIPASPIIRAALHRWNVGGAGAAASSRQLNADVLHGHQSVCKLEVCFLCVGGRHCVHCVYGYQGVRKLEVCLLGGVETYSMVIKAYANLRCFLCGGGRHCVHCVYGYQGVRILEVCFVCGGGKGVACVACSAIKAYANLRCVFWRG